MSDHSWGEPDNDESDSDLGAFDYLGDTDTESDADGGSDLDALGGYASPDAEAEHEAEDSDEDSEDAQPSPVDFDVTSPAGTVTAHATLTGRIQRIELSPDATSMTESELVRDILTTARLANMKGRAGQRAVMQGILINQGFDQQEAANYIDQTRDLPTPGEAEDAQAEVLAEYLRDHH